MATRRPAYAGPNPLVPLIAWVVGIIGMPVALWYGWPGVAVLYAALLVVSFNQPQAELTGKKDKMGNPTPAHEGEAAEAQKSKFWRDLRTAITIPGADWMPIPFVKNDNSIRGVWVVALGLGFIAAYIPQAQDWMRAINGVLAYVLVMGIAAARQRNTIANEVSPGCRFDTFGKVAKMPSSWVGFFFGAVAGFTIIRVLSYMPLRELQLATPYMVKTWPKLSMAADYPWWPVLIVAVITGGWVTLFSNWGKIALAHWREVCLARVEWNDMFLAAGLKTDTPPRLLDRVTYAVENDEVVYHDTFIIQGPEPGVDMLRVGGWDRKLVAAWASRGAGVKIGILEAPATDSQGQPKPGTKHAAKFEVVTWPQDYVQDIAGCQYDKADEQTQSLVKLWLRCAMAWAANAAGGYDIGILLEVTDLTDYSEPEPEPEEDEEPFDPDMIPEGMPPEMVEMMRRASLDAAVPADPEPPTPRPTALATRWAYLLLANPLRTVRRELTGGISGFAQTGVLVEHRGNSEGIFFGDLSVPGATFNGKFGIKSTEDFTWIAEADSWAERWSTVLKQNVNAPNPQRQFRWTDRIGRGTLHAQTFMSLRGENPRTYMGAELEKKLATALSNAPLVSVQGFIDTAAPLRGTRHPTAVTVVWAEGQVPVTFESIPPKKGNSPVGVRDRDKDGTLWLLNALVAKGFNDARMSQPEVYEIRCITAPPEVAGRRPGMRGRPSPTKSENYIWEISISLQDGVTFADVRQGQKRLQESMHAIWLRVAEDPNLTSGVKMYVGAKPEDANIVRPADRQRCVELDWDQAFLDSGLAKNGRGPIPLGSTIMKEPPVGKDGEPDERKTIYALRYEVVPGLGLTELQDEKARDKLRAATNRSFIDIQKVKEAANQFMVLCATDDPMPDYAPYDPEFEFKRGLPFATQVDGEAAMLNSTTGAHLMIAGVSGGGKSVAGQAFMASALLSGAQMVLIDYVKGGADFGFVKPYAIGWADTFSDAAATFKAVYAEVRRRVNLNKTHSVGSVKDLPPELRPKAIYIFVDEFAGLIARTTRPPAKSEDDAELEKQRVANITQYNDIENIRLYSQRIAAEARSADVHLVLMTQKLSAKMLDGMDNLKNNLARVLLGKASWGDKASALREATAAPSLGDFIPPGRGLFEPLEGVTQVIQVWYASQGDYTKMLDAAGIEPATPDDILDIEEFRQREQQAGFTEIDPNTIPELEEDNDRVVDLGEMELELDDLGDDDEDEDDAASGVEVPVEVTGDLLESLSWEVPLVNADAAEQETVTVEAEATEPEPGPVNEFEMWASQVPATGETEDEDDLWPEPKRAVDPEPDPDGAEEPGRLIVVGMGVSEPEPMEPETVTVEPEVVTPEPEPVAVEPAPVTAEPEVVTRKPAAALKPKLRIANGKFDPFAGIDDKEFAPPKIDMSKLPKSSDDFDF